MNPDCLESPQCAVTSFPEINLDCQNKKSNIESLMIPSMISKTTFLALLDTAAQVSVISDKIADELKRPQDFENQIVLTVACESKIIERQARNALIFGLYFLH